MIRIGRTDTAEIALLPRLANRHGLVTGATGTGKTVTLQRLAEQFSALGVPVFAADVKGDLSGIAAAGDPDGKPAARAASMGQPFAPAGCPTTLWDIFDVHGLPIRSSVHAMGPQLLSSMLDLNATQSGAMEIAFRKARDENEFMLTLDDLRWALNDMLEDRETVCRQYGNITASSISAIQRGILALEAQGGHALFGEPPFDVRDFLRVQDGRGVVNLLHADQLLEAPKLYATFLLWLLTELFRQLPEVGDLDKPKLVFFFDEAHLLFRNAPRPLLDSIERLVRLVRSKGVGVFFVTQSPADIPDPVLAQLGNRIQHALRAYTPKDRRLVKASADAFRPNPKLKVAQEITDMPIGTALISVMQDDGAPTMVEKVRVYPPVSQIGPISEFERRALIDNSPLAPTYARRFEDGQMHREFITRMRATAGLPAIEHSGETWQEGDYLKHIPRLPAPEPDRPRRSRNGWAAVISAAVAALCFAYVLT